MGGPSNGSPARQHRNREERQGGKRIGRHIQRRYADQQPPHQPRCPEARDQPDHDPRAGQSGGLPEHEPEYATRLRTERHATPISPTRWRTICESTP